MLPDGIHLMPLHGTVKINLPVGIHIAHGDGIRISVIAMKGKRTAGHALQYRLFGGNNWRLRRISLNIIFLSFKVGSINSIFISCIRQQNPLTVLSKIILRKVKQFNLPPKNEGFLHFEDTPCLFYWAIANSRLLHTIWM